MATDAGTAYIDVEERLDRLGRNLDRDGPGIFNGLGKKLALGFAAAFTAGIGGAAFVFKDLVSAGSDLQETMSKSREIFGANAKEMEKWASTAATSFGQSKREALDAAATFGNLFLQLDIGGEQATGMSRSLTELASDFASFHNAAPTDVIEAMTAAFRGEYDAVQKYVPTISAATVEQKALELGLAGSTKELTAQHKALATEKLLMEGAGKAMGDFDRTSGGLANQMRIAKARFEDFKGTLGTALIPIALEAMKVLERLGGGVKGLIDLFVKGDFTGALAKAFGWQEDSAIVATLFRIRDGAIALFGFIKDNAIPIAAGLATVLVAALIPAVTTLVTSVVALFSPVVLIVGAIAALVAGIVYAYQHFEGFRTVINGIASFLVDTVWPAIQGFISLLVEGFGGLVNWVRSHWEQISEAIGHVVAVIGGFIGGFVLTVTTLWRLFGDEILGVATVIWDQIRNVIETVVAIIGGIISVGLAIINGDWSAAWDGVKGILSAAWEFIRESVVNGIRFVVELVSDVPGQLLGALGDLGGILYDAGRAIISGLWEGMKDAVGGMLNWVGGLAGKIARLKGPLDYDRRLLTPAGKAIIQGLVGGMKAEEANLVRHLQRVTGIVGSIPSLDVGGLPGSVSSLVAQPAPAGRGDIIQHNSFTERQDPLLLARELAWAL